MIERIANAKINLALHVTGQREDGYHLLDSLVVFTTFGDRVIVGKPDHPHGPVALSIDGPFADGLSAGPENLVSSAALILRNSLLNDGVDPAPVAIHLEKNLPVASGIGGGSADAAACLLALQEYWQTDVDLAAFAKQLGADVAMCLHSRPLRARWTGEEIMPLTLAKSFHMVLVNPGIPLSTPEIFNALSSKENGLISVGELVDFPEITELKTLRNDLQPPAVLRAPVIGEIVDALTNSGAVLARMSGSGATCFGIYYSQQEAEAGCKEIRERHPDWWCVATSTTVS